MRSLPHRMRTVLTAIALTALPATAIAGGPEGNNAPLFDTECSTNTSQSCTIDSDCPGSGTCRLVTTGPTLKGAITVIADQFPSNNTSTAERPVVTVLLEIKRSGQRRFFSKTFQTSSGTGWPEIGEWFAFDENEFDIPPDPNSEDDVHDLEAERSDVPNWKFIRPCFGLKPVGDAVLEASQAMFPSESFTGKTPVFTKLRKRGSDSRAIDTYSSDLARVARYYARISFVTLSQSDPDCSEG